MAYIGSKPNDTRQLARREFSYAVTVASTTTFTGSDAGGKTLSYQPGELEVYMNGVRLDPADYTATTGSSVVLVSGANIGDNINIFAGQILPTDDYVSKAAGGVISSPITVNRNTTDGSIVSFNKDGSSVGSIGIQSSGFYIDGESGHEGLRFANGTVTPRENGADSNGSSDLGASNNRWKDLYLSGGVYLGGTGSANKLDDYETGTWTPTVATDSGTLGSVSGQVGRYIKIGKMVQLFYQFNITNLGSGSGTLVVSGKPFTEDNSAIAYYMGLNRPRSGTTGFSELDVNGNIYMYGSSLTVSFYQGNITYETAS